MNDCGFYGDNSFYQASNCKSLQGRNLTKKALFGNYELIDGSEAGTQAVRLKSFKVSPSHASVYHTNSRSQT